MPKLVEVKYRKSRVSPKKAARKRVARKTKEVSLSKLKKRLDTVFSLWTRLSSADANGICECYTCGHKVHWKKIHAGHYISRFYLWTRWFEPNVKTQCMMCNLWKRGDPVAFRMKLVKEIGEADVRFMEETSRRIFKPTRLFYETEIANYEQRLKSLTP